MTSLKPNERLMYFYSGSFHVYLIDTNCVSGNRNSVQNVWKQNFRSLKRFPNVVVFLSMFSKYNLITTVR